VTPGPGPDAFLDSLTDTSLYSIGAYFADRHPDLIDDVVAEGDAIEAAGLEAWAATHGATPEHAFQTLMTALGVRYFKAVGGKR
jgi:hypothetical protein